MAELCLLESVGEGEVNDAREDASSDDDAHNGAGMLFSIIIDHKSGSHDEDPYVFFRLMMRPFPVWQTVLG